MSFIHTPVLAGASGNQGIYEIEQSLRFDGSNSYLNRTPGGSGSTTTWTISCWVKRSKLGSAQMIWSAGTSNVTYLTFNADDTLKLRNGSGNADLITTQRFRDPSAWYHIVVRWDTTNSTSADRIIFYVNGTELVPGDFGTHDDAGSSEASNWNTAVIHNIGRYATNSTSYFGGYLAEFNFIDDALLDADDFGESDANGVWRPKEYAGTYTGNSFYLKFDADDVASDSGGRENDWTANSITTSGTGTDVMSDTPTKNFPTLSPLDNLNGRYSNDPTNGNLEVSIPSDSVSKRNYPGFYSTQAIPTTGKFYFEFEPSQQYTTINIVDVDEVDTISSGDHVGASDKLSFQYFCESGNYRFNGSSTASGLGGFSSGNIYGVAVDLENETFRVYENGVAGSELSVSGYLGADARIAPSIDSSGASGTVTMNFGQREFLYPPGTYSASDYFNTVTWTGDNNDDRSITGVGFKPDLVWYKRRNATASHLVFDSVRGATKALSSDNETTENTEANALQAFETDGFQVGSDANSNSSSYNYVAWCWKAGGTASDNTDGSITASVSASDAAGFSVVKFEGNNTADASVGHGLSTAPSFIITKNIDNSSAYWATYIASAGKSKKFYINHHQAPDAAANWLDVSDSTITWKQTDVNNVNTNNNTFICYCWTEKTGVSKFGSYTGNGSTNGPLVSDLGFAPALLVIKRDGSSEFAVYDSARGDNNQLRWDSDLGDNTNSAVNVRLTNTGFKIETSDAAQNADGNTYYYMAWAKASSADADFKSLNTANLPAPGIKDGSNYFNTVLYTGDDSVGRAITVENSSGASWQPDFVWVKARNQAYSTHVYDSVRGAGKRLLTNGTQIEYDQGSSDGVTAFNSDGFDVSHTNSDVANQLNTTYAAWTWKAGGSVSADNNSDGTITSTVSANTTAGFSIVSYTANGTSTEGDTVGHGLGVAPKMIIAKDREATQNWFAYFEEHPGAAGGYNFNLTQGAHTSDDGYWDSTAPTSTVFTIGNYHGYTAEHDMIAYCFAEVEGYSKFGKYTGSGGKQFVHLGFAPEFVMLKRADSSNDVHSWYIFDATRDPINNNAAEPLMSNKAFAEGTLPNGGSGAAGNVDFDFLSNGFGFPSYQGAGFNASGATMIYAAFAKNPFGGDGVSPATAR